MSLIGPIAFSLVRRLEVLASWEEFWASRMINKGTST